MGYSHDTQNQKKYPSHETHIISPSKTIQTTPSCKEDHDNCFQDVWISSNEVDCVWNVMTHAQKPDFVFRRNGRDHLNRLGRQFSRLLAAEVCASAVVMLDTPCSEVVWRVLVTHSIRQFPLHFPSRASCAITFQLDSNTVSADCYWRILKTLQQAITKGLGCCVKMSWCITVPARLVTDHGNTAGRL